MPNHVDSTTNRWAILGLIACDASYQRTTIPANSLLSEFFDSKPNRDFLTPELVDRAGIYSYFSGGEVVIPDFKVVEHVRDPDTGFGAVIYQSEDKTQAIVAFTGTNGPDGQDWWTNLNLGISQWTANRERVEAVINNLTNADDNAFSGELLFTGQSLGGALAEYSAYEYARDHPTRPNIRLITFNGLGGVDGIKKMGSYDPNALDSAQVAHFYIKNDIVSRLGGGHVESSPSAYVLNSSVEHDAYEYVEDSGAIRSYPAFTTAQHFVDAHRIESGFYRHFAKSHTDFTSAEKQELVPIASAAMQQRGAALAGWLSDHKNYSEAEAWARIASSAGAMLAFMGPNEIPDFNNAVDAFTAHLAAASDPQTKAFHDRFASTLKTLPYDPSKRALGLALAVAGWAAAPLASRVEKVASVLSETYVDLVPELIRNELANIVSVKVSNPVLGAKAAVGLATLAGSIFRSDGPTVDPADIGMDLNSEAWQAAFVGTVSQAALAQGKPVGTVLAEFGRGLIETAEPFTKVHDPDANLEMYREVGDAVVGAAKALGNAYDDLTAKASDALFDVETAISRLEVKDIVEGIVQVLTGSTNAYGGDLRIPKEGLDPFNTSLAEAAQVLEDAGQAIVIRPGYGSNPFDAEAYAGENSVSVNGLREGGVSTFTLFLPFAASEKGQRVELKLSGPNADKFQVLLYADPVPVAGDGTFELTVTEGARQLVFSLRAGQDVDSDQVLSLDAQLADDEGDATHRNHAELTINFDAVAEAAPTINTTVSGTALDDNRNSTGGRRPVVGTTLNNRVQGLAGRDEVSGNAGDDIAEGGSGIDVVTGDAGDDQVFADVQLTEPQIQALIASSATAVTSGAKPSKLFVTSSEWLQGGLGSDTVVGTVNDDIMLGGGGKDLLVAGAGHDVINGDDSYRPGDITTAFVETSVGTGAPFNNYYSSIVSDVGSVGDEDVIHAGSGDDVVSALFGNDTVWGDDGHDVISGGDSDDSLFGSNGNDQIAGDSYGAVIGDAASPFIGDDFISGDDGDDKLYGDGGEDTILGGDGNDQIRGNNNIAQNGVSPTAQDDGGDYLSGGAGHDNVTGDSGDDIIDGDDGDDVLLGDSDATPVVHQGSDQLDGGAGNDDLRGYGGDDLLVAGDGDDTLLGDDGDDAAFGDGGEDQVTGGSGADFLAGGAADDTLLGGTGDDELEGDAGNDNLAGEEGADRIVGNDGDDFLFGDSEATAQANAGNDYLDGGSGNDYLRGYAGGDELHGGSGDDQLTGESGDDSLHGDAGNDSLDGGDGNDSLDGGSANDTINGQAGDDRIDGGLGVNALFGGDGNDTFLVNDIAVNWVNDLAGIDRLEINTVQSIDEIVARRNGSTDDLVLEAAGGQTIIVGGMHGAGPQTIAAADGSTTSLANLVAAADADTGTTNVPIVGTSGNDYLYGTPSADVLLAHEGDDQAIGLEGDDKIDGGPGNDWLIAGAGDDEIIGGPGNDNIVGNTGDDSLIGGSSNDTLEGGAGADRYFFSRGGGQDAIVDDGGSAPPGEINQLIFDADIRPEDVASRTDGQDNLFLSILGTSDVVSWQDAFNFNPPLSYANAFGEIHFADGTVWSLDDLVFDLMQGTDGNDEIFGTTRNDVINGGDGDDHVSGAGGIDIAHGGDGDDWIAAPDYSTIYGDEGNDWMFTDWGGAFGGPGDDQIDNVAICGDSGSATIEGGAGNDVIMPGGNGSVVRFGPGDGHDEVHTRSDQFQWGGPVERETEFHFTGGIRPEEVTAARQGNDLVITVDADAGAAAATFANNSASKVGVTNFLTPSTIALVGFFAHPTIVPTMHSERFRFDDDSGVSAQWLIDRSASPAGRNTTGTNGADTLNGSDGDDVIDGLDGFDNIYGAAGADTLRGGAWMDGLSGGFGDDSLWGGDGDDSLSGNSGNDTVHGESGNDTLRGHRGNNRLFGGAGDDVLEAWEGDDFLDAGTGDDTITGGSGSNVYVFGRGSGTDTIKSRGKKSAFEVDVGTDTVEFGAGIAPTDIKLRTVMRVNGWNDLEVSIAGSTDRLYVEDFTGVLFASARMQFKFSDGTTWDSATLNERIQSGDNTVDTVTGTPGDDALTGYDSADRLFGLAGNDSLHGGRGNDYLDGGPGADEMDGFEDDDTFVVDDVGDLVTDWYGQDTVVSSIDYVLPDGIENLELTGSATTGMGNIWDNTLVGNGLPNTLDGGIGYDNAVGGPGDDTYFIDNLFDSVTETRDGGNDTLHTAVSYTLPENVENLRLIGSDTIDGTGNVFSNSITGNSASNAIDGGEGADAMSGGAGNDYYAVDDDGDVVVENAAEGTDWVSSTISYTLGANVEGLQLHGTAANGTGNALANTIYGNAAANVLDGAGGADTLSGREGNDTYVVDAAGDTTQEAANAGTDTVNSSVSFTLASNVENLTLTGAGAINGTGNTLANVIVGNAGQNTLNGGAGIDTMRGGAGNDTYVADNASESIIEVTGEGTDTVQAGFTYTLGANLENLTLTGSTAINGTGNALNNALTGNAAANTLNGGTGVDTMTGGAGNDIYIVDAATELITEAAGAGTDAVQSSATYTLAANVESLTLTGSTAINGTGNTLVNQIIGNSGNNVLDGGGGSDTMTGGAGNDIYYLDAAGDVVTEAASAGTDTVNSAITYTLGANVENLTLTGSSAINATGNTQNNVLTGNSGANTLAGGTGADTMIGAAGNDTYVVDTAGDVVTEVAGQGTDLVQSSLTYTLVSEVENLTLTGSSAINATGNTLANALTGNAGNNMLDGGGGADSLRGGGGNDTYVIDNAGDVVTENASEGTDLIQSNLTYTLGGNVENLTLTGTSAINATGNTIDNILVGNTANNVLTGGAGNDTMRGGAGNDTYVVDAATDVVTENASEGTDLVQSSVTLTLAANVENLTLTGAAAINGTGNTLANVVTGNAGNNILDGGTAADSLVGGAGNDTYVVDNAADVVTEAASAGTDLVNAGVTHALGANVENLTLTGVAAINGTGNSSNNTLTGNSGNNVLAGGAGTDTMIGGTGNDTYVVDVSTDAITEAAGQGTDLVQASLNWTLGAELESLTLTGAASLTGTGNALANTITGNAGDNTIDGGAGIDTMAGSTGNDTYVVDNASDIVTEAASAGIDAINAGISYVTPAHVEFLTLTGSAALNGTGNTLDNWLRGNTGINTLSGMDGNDTLWGNLGDDTMNGNNGNDLLQGGGGNDVLTDTAGNNLLDGGAGTDTLTGGAAREMLIGGTGADTLTTAGGADVIGFNKGDGADLVNASVGTDDTLSLGGGLAYSDLKLRKTGLDLILDANNGDQITFRNWYQTGVNNKSVLNLQVVADAMAAYNPASLDSLLNKKLVTFNFGNLVSQFDVALQANPTLTSWSLTNGLASAHQGGSDTAAIGGDFAYDFGHRNALTNIGAIPAQSVLAGATFGTAAQTLQAPAALYSGTVRLA